MRPPAVLIVAGALWCMANEGTPVRAKVEEYPVSARTEKAAVGAEYMGRTLMAGRRSIVVEDYIVIEVAVFPSVRPLRVAHADFTLRLNGGRGVMMSQTPGMVRASLLYPDWESSRQLTVAGQSGDSGVILGSPRQVPRFPGDNRPAERRPGPEPPKAPTVQSPAVEPEIPNEDLPVEFALREGEATGPVSGYVYFPFRGKLEKVKSMELLYRPSGASDTLRLPLR